MYSFRPSIAIGVEGTFEQLMFDLIAATVVDEIQAEAYGGDFGGNVPNLSSDAQRKVRERIESQEKLVKKRK